jgi:hypothetical protein
MPPRRWCGRRFIPWGGMFSRASGMNGHQQPSSYNYTCPTCPTCLPCPTIPLAPHAPGVPTHPPDAPLAHRPGCRGSMCGCGRAWMSSPCRQTWGQTFHVLARHSAHNREHTCLGGGQPQGVNPIDQLSRAQCEQRFAWVCWAYTEVCTVPSTPLPSRQRPRPPDDHDAITILTVCHATTLHYQHTTVSILSITIR